MSEPMTNNKFNPWPMPEPAYTEQDLQRTHELIVEAMKKLGSVAGAGYWPVAKVVAAEFARIRSEARAGMREACADAASQDAQAILTSVGNIQDTDAGDEIDEDLNRIEKCSLRVASRIRSLPDLAADEAIERIKAEAERKGRLEGGLRFEDFSRINRQRCEAPNGFHHALNSWSASDWVTATTGELGEMANIVKKLNRVRDNIPGNDKTPEELRKMFADELADTFIYLDLLAQSQGISLKESVVRKFDKTSEKRGYPERIAALEGKETEHD